MNTNPNADYSELLAQVRHFHSILNTAWPRPGVPQMAKASVFIGTKLFTALENGLIQIQHALEALHSSSNRNELVGFWKTLAGLFLQLKGQNSGERSERIDQALNLLYLASGVFYHRLAELSSVVPKADERMIGVEEMAKLLELCGWSKPSQTVNSTFVALLDEMTVTADVLQKNAK